MSEFIKEDEFYNVKFRKPTGEVTAEIPVNAKYDRVDHWPRIGAWAVKAYDDEVGLMVIFLPEDQVTKLLEQTDLPLIERDSMYHSEHEVYLRAQAAMLDEKELGLDDIPEPQEEEEDEE
jgi:hypothetical protein